jgi:MarR family transcriptional regulator, temperature-dependent positive regulator of motility
MTRKSPAQDLAELMTLVDLTFATSHLLRRAHARAEGLFQEIMEAGDLTPRQMAVLTAIYQRPGATVAELAEAIAVDRNTLGEMLARMIDRGLVERRPSPDDGRAWSISLSAAGCDVLRRVLPHNDDLQAAILEPLPPEYRPLFVKCLRLMAGVESPVAGVESPIRYD